MVSEPKKIEDFDDLDETQDPADPVEGHHEADVEVEEPMAEMEAEKDRGEAEEEMEELDSLVDEAPEMMFAEYQDSKEQEVLVKYCLFCREIIPAEAIACKHCGHVVHIFEGAVFKQLYWFFWGGLIAWVGTLLPFYNGEMSLVTGCTTFPGSMYLIFSSLLIVAMGMSIYSKRLIISPVFLMFIPAVHTWWMTVREISKAPDLGWYQFLYDIDALNWLSNNVGSGLLLTLIGSTMVGLTFVISLFSAVLGGGKNKAVEKRERGGSKARGRRH